MKRYTIVGHFGAKDPYDVPSSGDDVKSRLNLLSSDNRLAYGIGQALSDLQKYSVVPTEIGLDLLILASHIQAADTRIARSVGSEDSWTREIRLVVPVSDLERWSSATEVLQRMLNFLTGDLWTISFRLRPSDYTLLAPVQKSAHAQPQFDTVSLFSGGLDSLIAAIDMLEGGRAPLFVSHAGEGLVSNSQDKCYSELKAAYKTNTFERLRIWMNFDSDLVPNGGSENTTRGRSFLFIAIGIFSGTGLGKPFVLNVPENGLIALNVPLDPLRLGALSTRTTHPFYLARWNELLIKLGISARIENSYWNKTKGEMVADCRNRPLLDRIVAYSLSCSSPGKLRWGGQKPGHCGYCVPCLIRRAALGPGDPTIYGLSDLHARTLDTNRAEGQQIRSFQLAIERIKSQPKLARYLIYKPGPLSDEQDHIDDLAGVYMRGLEEVGRLLDGVRAQPD